MMDTLQHSELLQSPGRTAAATQGTSQPVSPLHEWLAIMSHVDPRYGGLSSAVPRLGLGLSAEGFRFSLAAFVAPGEQHAPAGYGGDQLRFWPVARSPWVGGTGAAALRKQFAAIAQGAEGLHVHGLWEVSTAVGCRTARQVRRPYVLSAHGMLEPWALAKGALKKRVYAALLERSHVAHAACLHALTEAEAGQYRQFGAKGPIAIVPNAVEAPADLSGESFWQAYPALRTRRVVLFLGRLHPKKGLDLLAEAWAKLAPRYPEAILVLAGPDSEGTQAKVQASLQARGLGDSVVFTGMLAGALKWSALAAAEVFVLPSYSEGLSMGVLEALAAGVPVVLTRNCHMPDVTLTGAGTEIHPEARQLAEALEARLASSPAENAAMGRHGAALVASRYSPARVAQQMAEVYRFAATGQRPATATFQEALA